MPDQATSTTAEAVPTPKTLNGCDPDVTVIVGSGKNAKEFRHHSLLLKISCEYFAMILGNDTKESKEKVITLPDKDPAEWEVVYPFLEPASLQLHSQVISRENVFAILPWFHEMGMPVLIDRCDCTLVAEIDRMFPQGQTTKDNYMSFPALASIWGASDRFNLSKTKALTIQCIINYFQTVIHHKDLHLVFYRNPMFIEQVKPLLLQNPEGNPLWNLLVSTGCVSQELLARYSREHIVHSPTFSYMVACAVRASFFDKSISPFNVVGLIY